jgi:hypothetical protein
VAPAAAWATANEAPWRLRQRGQLAVALAGTGARLEARPRTLPHCEEAPARPSQAVMDFSDTISLRGVAALQPCAVYDLRTQGTGEMRESLRLTKPAPLRVGSPSVAQRLRPHIPVRRPSDVWPSEDREHRGPVSGRSPMRTRSTHGLESEFRYD